MYQSNAESKLIASGGDTDISTPLVAFAAVSSVAIELLVHTAPVSAWLACVVMSKQVGEGNEGDR